MNPRARHGAPMCMPLKQPIPIPAAIGANAVKANSSSSSCLDVILGLHDVKAPALNVSVHLRQRSETSTMTANNNLVQHAKPGLTFPPPNHNTRAGPDAGRSAAGLLLHQA